MSAVSFMDVAKLKLVNGYFKLIIKCRMSFYLFLFAKEFTILGKAILHFYVFLLLPSTDWETLGTQDLYPVCLYN